MNEHDEVQEESIALYESELQDIDSGDSGTRGITYKGQDFDIDGLVKRLEREDIKIPTFGHDDRTIQTAGFQRAFVWRKPQMDKFIESILLGYPIPGIFLVKQDSDNVYLVLDGQQRLQTLRYFCDGKFQKRDFKLQNVSEEYQGLTYKTLPSETKREFNNTFIQAIIVSSDGSEDSLEAIYGIFERLNSGGTQLTPHEIRVALYAGNFIGFLEKLNNLPCWRELYGKKSPRLRDQELVLRIIGLHLYKKNYKRPLKKFLNKVVARHRQDHDLANDVDTLFEKSAGLLLDSAGASTFRSKKGRQINSALAEALMVGLMKRVSGNTKFNPSSESIKKQINKLKEDDDFLESITTSTADESRVKKRMKMATDAFRSL